MKRIKFIPKKFNRIDLGYSGGWDHGNNVKDLSFDVLVLLYVVLGKFTIDSMMDLTFDDGVKQANDSETVNSDDIVVLENFKLKLAGKEDKNA